MATSLTSWWRRARYGAPICVVSGLPRSGTSMMMRMLTAGGLPALKDDIRKADEDNPRGYFELERVKDLHDEQDKSWLRGARGKVVKIISQLLESLPAENNYQVIFMERNLDEVLASQAKMLDRRGEEAGEAGDEAMKEMFLEHLSKVRFILRRRPQFETLYCSYAEVVAHPRREAERVNEFLGGTLDPEAMVEVVEPKLYRNRVEGSGARSEGRGANEAQDEAE